MKWVILLVAVLLVALYIESKLEKKKKDEVKDLGGDGIYSPSELIGEMKAKQDGK